MHGSDIYNSVERIARSANSSSFVSKLSFRDFARRDCQLLWENPAHSATLIAQGRIDDPNGHKSFWIVESPEDTSARYEFDEASITAPAIRNQNEISLTQRSRYTPIEEVIALTKRLNIELTPDVPGQWLFGQLNLERALPDTYSTLAIKRTGGITGRFSMNAIAFDDCEVGNIRFIVGAP